MSCSHGDGNSKVESSKATQSITPCCWQYVFISFQRACRPMYASPVHPTTELLISFGRLLRISAIGKWKRQLDEITTVGLYVLTTSARRFACEKYAPNPAEVGCNTPSKSRKIVFDRDWLLFDLVIRDGVPIKFLAFWFKVYF